LIYCDECENEYYLDNYIQLLNAETNRNISNDYDIDIFISSNYKFEILSEEDEEIDIDGIEIEEIEILQEVLGKCDLWKGNEEYILKVINENNNRLTDAILKVARQNDNLIKAVKLLNKKIK